MIKHLLRQLETTPQELIKHNIFGSLESLDVLVQFYQRIGDRLNNYQFIKEKPRQSYAYDSLITHSKRVALYAAAVARADNQPPKSFGEISLAAFLHDIEKVYWPIELLYEKTKDQFSENDRKRILEHPMASAVFVERLTNYRISQGILTSIIQHHEDLDGRGYPQKLSGAEICLGARIIRVTDSYDTMTSTRIYKRETQSHEAAIAELKQQSGTTYDGRIVQLLERVLTYEKRLEIEMETRY